MTENLLPEAVLALLQPHAVAPGVLALVADNAPTLVILRAGADAFERTHITLTEGVFVRLRADSAVQVATKFDAPSDRTAKPCRRAASLKAR